VVDIIEYFWHNLCHYKHKFSQNLRKKAESGANYAQKTDFITLIPVIMGAV
jgi:hypothetical protein